MKSFRNFSPNWVTSNSVDAETSGYQAKVSSPCMLEIVGSFYLASGEQCLCSKSGAINMSVNFMQLNGRSHSLAHSVNKSSQALGIVQRLALLIPFFDSSIGQDERHRCA